LVAFAFPVVAQQNPSDPDSHRDYRNPKTITVSGSAEMEIVPDEIYVLVELKEYDKIGAGKIGLESIKADFLNRCKQAGLADSVISIAAYDGDNPSSYYYYYYYYWKKRGNKDVLYSSISYQVKFSDSKTMDALVTLLDNKATEKFMVIRTSHSRIMEYRKQLKIRAIKAAKEKANYLAEAIDEKAGEAISINELENNNYWGNYGLAIANSAISQPYNSDEAVNNSPGTDFKKIKLQFKITAVFALK
ncbi:MAG TPA: SIMPL domain-containing protein, partial [Chitinophagaceae bacterium]|nr:SIMPL domain-containing protein [Chitinophagaceae bacterium]